MPETPNQRLRVAFTTGNHLAAGLTAAAICEEDIEPVGFILDQGPVQPSRRSLPPRALPLWTRLWQLLRLAWRYPRHYLPILLRRLGYRPPSAYERYRDGERPVIEAVVRECSEEYRSDLVPLLRRFPTFEEVADRCRAPLRKVANVNSEEAAAALREMRPDVIVSIGDRIIKQHILDIPRLGVLNAHSSLLPAYRGTTTEFWQLRNGEKETGVTIHWMSPHVDEGPIVVQERWPIRDGATHWQLRALSQFMRLPAWKKAIRLVARGQAGSPQPQTDAGTFGQPQLGDEYDFYTRR